MEQIIFYILMFFTGCMFGSFFTLAVYRLPLHQDITHERSYCPNCNHKLSFFDLIPVLSYIFLGGKCRYCKQKIRIRYLLLEILTGTVFLVFSVSINMSFSPFKIDELIYLIAATLYMAGLIIIAGIDKEKRTIMKNVLLYEIVITSIYMVYLCILSKANIYRYAIYLSFLALILIFDNIYYKKQLKDSYVLQILELAIIMIIFSGERVYVATVILTLLSIAFNYIEKKIINLGNKVSKKEEFLYYRNLDIGFYLVCR